MRRPAITIAPEVCQDLGQALKREWLETNGLGGFASSTITGLNTRRYHGLLTAATKPPVGRMVLLSKLEETVIINGKRYELSANRYPGTIHPQGYLFLQGFELNPLPTFVWNLDGVEIRKTVFMIYGENTTIVEYEATAECELELRPLIAFRDYHSLTHRNDALNGRITQTADCVTVSPYSGLPALNLSHNGATIEPTGDWYCNFEYDEERERGLDYQEDLFNPFLARFALAADATATVIASTGDRQAADAGRMRTAEIERRGVVLDRSPSDDPLMLQLVAAADQYVVRRGDLQTIIAGYHWFSDWGRDTMIALPGIALVTGRFETARHILQAFAGSVDRGMLPNRFPDAGEDPEYNTVDATLWFFEAAGAYIEYTGDEEFVLEQLYPKLREIIDWHVKGTRYGICLDRDGLLNAGEPGAQLTWMDAKIGDWVVTPRHGKPVEVQALWYNALCTLRGLAERAGDLQTEIFVREMSELARRSFNQQFWNEESGCLYDVVNPHGADESIRPNQIFAISLHHSILYRDRARSVAQTVERELLTPAGLRSLSPRDPAYRPRYEGGVTSRDSAYHQGTVWPWLMGPFISAYIKAHGGTSAAREQAREWVRNFSDQLLIGGLGHISEIADAEYPHQPRGCIAQAWSVAELLRAATEHVFSAPRTYAAGVATCG